MMRILSRTPELLFFFLIDQNEKTDFYFPLQEIFKESLALVYPL